jgi:hypothetical protein
MPPKKKAQDVSIEVMTLNTTSVGVKIIGQTPLICNAMSAKAQQEILLPGKKLNQAERQSKLKHNPLEEFRAAPYRTNDEEAPTRIIFPAGGVKAAIASAAIDIPGAAKAQIGRLCHIKENNVPIYGIPQMFMSVVRNAGMNRTPDVRTRAILAEWATEFTVTFVTPNLATQSVINLVAAAGLIIGLGDWRPEKGKGNFGQFKIVEKTDEEAFGRIVKAGGMAAQDAALEDPTAYDVETETLWEWFRAECERREFKIA